jgi:hypothetical protein
MEETRLARGFDSGTTTGLRSAAAWRTRTHAQGAKWEKLCRLQDQVAPQRVLGSFGSP